MIKETAAVRQSQLYYCRTMPYSAVAAGQGSLEGLSVPHGEIRGSNSCISCVT